MHAAVGQGAGKTATTTTNTNNRGTLHTARAQTASPWATLRGRLARKSARRGECPRCGSRNVTERFFDVDPETGRSVRVYPGPERKTRQGVSFTLPYALVVTGLLVVALLLDRQLGSYSVAHLPFYALGLLGVFVAVVWSMRRTAPKQQYQSSFDCHACRYSSEG